MERENEGNAVHLFHDEVGDDEIVFAAFLDGRDGLARRGETGAAIGRVQRVYDLGQTIEKHAVVVDKGDFDPAIAQRRGSSLS